MIKNCSTCRIGAETVDEYPEVCPFYKKHFYKHCGNYAPLEIKASKGRIDVNERDAPVSTCHILKAKEVRYGQD